MRAYKLKGLAVFSLVLLFLSACAIPQETASQKEIIPPGENMKVGYDAFQEMGKSYLNSLDSYLKMISLWVTSDEFATEVRRARESGWDPLFVNLAAKTKVWRDKVDPMNAEQLFELSEKIAGGRGSSTRTRSDLLEMARSKGSTDAVKRIEELEAYVPIENVIGMVFYQAYLTYTGSHLAWNNYNYEELIFSGTFYHELEDYKKARSLLNQPNPFPERWTLDIKYDAHFLKVIDQAIHWRESLDRMSGEELYDLYLEYEKREYGKPRSRFGSSILSLAMDKNSQAALFRFTQIHLNRLSYSSKFVEKTYRRSAFSNLIELGKKFSDVRAQLALAKYYENGKFVSKNLAKSYFWYFLAAKNGANISENKFTELAGAYSKENRGEIKRYFSSFRNDGSVPTQYKFKF